MKQIQTISILSLSLLTLFSCTEQNDRADGYGNFEATETTISAESNGKLMAFNVEEGQQLTQGSFIGYIDTIPLALKREQLAVSKELIASKSRGVLSQINVLNAQLAAAEVNKVRVENLIRENAGTQKQLDDINGEMAVIRQQTKSIEIQNAPVMTELKSIDVQIKQINDQIEKGKIINPIDGTVLVKYAEPNEVTAFGKPLYKIANLSVLELRVYVSETQLSSIKIGQEVEVKIDTNEDMESLTGTITWVSSEAEFTPKIIQTKEERVALVYAVKVKVKNDGRLKIGMPAEMWIASN
ncbi:HlyD family secretion protein [Roseivirga echinicomitans]|uniref:ABC transporter n=1 Tax=Roseivirga echinicomitans TaxID=296218 RepID=A0A150X231_9BACT|nr:HlyD family efflux transporter periplasmic adaptor subunit [Roseivirga echinicomitans]KYG72778.1 ABC transporter [Roseivirga echinicomitans]